MSTSAACGRASTASARADASATFPARKSAWTTSDDTRSASRWPPGSSASARRRSSTVTSGACADASRAASRSHATACSSPRSAPSTRWSATSSRSAPAAISATAASRCRRRRAGARHVLVDRVVHELVPEHDSVVGLVEQLGVERVAELGDDLGRRAAGDSGDIAERHGVAEHRRDLQQLQRRRRQMSQAADHEVTRARPAAPNVVASTSSPDRGAARPRRPASAAWPWPTAGSRRPWPAWRSAPDREAPRAPGARARPPRRASAAGDAACARPPAARSSSNRTTSAGSGDGRAVTTTSSGSSGSWRATDRIASRLALSAQWMSSATNSAGPSAHDGSTRSTISSTTRYWSRRRTHGAPRAPAGQQRADRRPARVRRPPVQAQRGGDDTEGTRPLEGMRLAGEHRHAPGIAHRRRCSAPGGSCRCRPPPRSTSTDARPSLSRATSAWIKASSPSRPTSPSADAITTTSPLSESRAVRRQGSRLVRPSARGKKRSASHDRVMSSPPVGSTIDRATR